jgi:hypothetical protein
VKEIVIASLFYFAFIVGAGVMAWVFELDVTEIKANMALFAFCILFAHYITGERP